MERVLIKDLKNEVGKNVLIKGWISVRRDQGKMVFFDIRDRSGSVQGVVLPGATEAIAVAKEIRPEFVVEMEGVVNKRPEKNMSTEIQNGDIELEIKSIKIISKAEVPFELNSELNLDTHLDNLPYTIRSQRGKDIFTMQATILEEYRSSLRKQDFTEFQAPTLAGADAEGGATAFKVDYYYNKVAYLATSPQLYKEIMVGVFERPFTIAKIFRAEKHSTARHLSEVTQMDFEMGFIKDHTDVMNVLEKVIKDVVQAVTTKHKDIFARFKVSTPLVPEIFPILKLYEAQDILGAPHENDMEPEQERSICEWAKEKHNSDFVFITHFPTVKRAFYTYEEKSEAPLSRGFDLLFRGLEINSGSQRIHNYEEMVRRIKERGMKPENFSFYLQAFKVGMPPHGGSSTGLERFTARMLEISNIKEATLFPRDINRIDTLLSE
ncbi:MAG: aspartate--tRNA(Asn) ligase [Patescibacteria group bacterium]